MKRRELFGKVHYILLALTAVFLAALFWTTSRERGGLGEDAYAVRTERGVPEERLMPERQLLNLNTASAEELEALPGIGPALARSIVEYREEHGPFASVDELTAVSGIGEAKLEAIRADVTVGGEEE